jgi:hypothetical protein
MLAATILNDADGLETPAARTNKVILEEALAGSLLIEVSRNAQALASPFKLQVSD